MISLTELSHRALSDSMCVVRDQKRKLIQEYIRVYKYTSFQRAYKMDNTVHFRRTCHVKYARNRKSLSAYGYYHYT